MYRRLRDDAEALCNAVASDRKCLAAAAEAEYRLTMDGIRKIHDQLQNFAKKRNSSRTEQESSSQRLAVGLVAIRPTNHSRLYSILIALCAAIAAGNCVLLELAEPECSIDKVLSLTLKSVIASGIVQVSAEHLQEDHLAQFNLFVDQNDRRSIKSSAQLAGPHKSRAVAVVHSNSDIIEASQQITTSRLSPHNTSPYSPSLVHIHQAALEKFRSTCLAYSEEVQSPDADNSAYTLAGNELNGLLREAESQGVIKVYRNATSGLNIVEVLPKLHRSSPILNSNIKGPCIVLLPYGGITDRPTLVAPSAPLLAVYLFADMATSKSLAEEAPATVAYFGQVPLSLLHGPASPSSHVHELHPRYTSDMFSTIRPIVVLRTPDIPGQVADLAVHGSWIERFSRTIVERVAALVVVPAIFSVFMGFWNKSEWKGTGSPQLTFTVASLGRDLKGFGA